MKKFAVFDIDGTLLRWQLFHAVINNLGKEGILGKSAYKDIKESRLRWKQRVHENAYVEYEQLLVTTYYDALHKIPAEDFDNAVEATINEYRDQVYVYTSRLLKNLKAEGYFLLAVSGSHIELVDHIAKHYGFDDWVGSRYERKDGKFTGKRELTYSDKHLILNKLITKHHLSLKDSVGIGDSGGDISLLEIVEKPIAFNPARELFEHARNKGWKIVVERKNVVYELEARDGLYILG